MKANAILYVDDTNSNEIKKSLPNVNPLYVPKYGETIDSGKAVTIKSACQALNGLTTNTFKATNLELTEDITDATAPKPAPTSSVYGLPTDCYVVGDENYTQGAKSFGSIVTLHSGNTLTITTNSNGTITARALGGDPNGLNTSVSGKDVTVSFAESYATVIEISIAETATYAAQNIYVNANLNV